MTVRIVLCGLVVLLLSVRAIALISIDEEIAAGRQAQAKARKELPELRDAQLTRYLNGVAARLVRVAPGPKYPYTVSVVDYREINAFALPGGPVWLHRGVIHATTRESQVAAVLAHEIAHIAQRHGAAKMTNAGMAHLGFGLLGALLGNGTSARTAAMAAGVMTDSMFLKFSRDDEREADRVGLQMMARAGWDPRGMLELFEILRRARDGDPNAVERFFSSHPSPADRIEQLQDAVKRHRGGRRDSSSYRAIRKRLLEMKAPGSMPKP